MTNQCSSLTHRLLGLLKRPISGLDRQRAALHVLDWIGCAAAGVQTEPGQVFLRYANTLPPGECPAMTGHSLTASDAALINGSLGNVLEMDDFYRTALVHPGPVIVPAALAVASAVGASGDAMLDSIVLGFEAMIRIGESVGARHYYYFHNTSTCGVFGAAVAAGALQGLSSEKMLDALGQAGTQASGLWQCRIEDTMSKQLHNGRAAQSGVMSALLADLGLIGAAHILEGERGFFNAMCPDGDPAQLTADPDSPWRIHGTSFKPWPACRHTHPTIDAALAIRDRIDPDRITQIVVQTYRDAIQLCDRPLPVNPVQAKFSLQHAGAVVLLHGKPQLRHFGNQTISEEPIASLRSKVVLQEQPCLTQAYPRHFGGSLIVEHNNGLIVQHTVHDAWGDPEHPMSAIALKEKARMLLENAGYETADIEALANAALALPGAPDTTALARLMTHGRSRAGHAHP